MLRRLVLGFRTERCESRNDLWRTTNFSRVAGLLPAGRLINGRPTAYVCRNYACQLPTNDADTMMAEFAR